MNKIGQLFRAQFLPGFSCHRNVPTNKPMTTRCWMNLERTFSIKDLC